MARLCQDLHVGLLGGIAAASNHSTQSTCGLFVSASLPLRSHQRRAVKRARMAIGRGRGRGTRHISHPRRRPGPLLCQPSGLPASRLVPLLMIALASSLSVWQRDRVHAGCLRGVRAVDDPRGIPRDRCRLRYFVPRYRFQGDRDTACGGRLHDVVHVRGYRARRQRIHTVHRDARSASALPEGERGRTLSPGSCPPHRGAHASYAWLRFTLPLTWLPPPTASPAAEMSSVAWPAGPTTAGQTVTVRVQGLSTRGNALCMG